MLRLNASFSKKVPVAGQDFSSQSYHASVEVEVPDGLTPEQLRSRIHATFALVRGSVEAEIGGDRGAAPAALPSPAAPVPAPAPAPAAVPAASSKQIQYVTRLALSQGMDPGRLAEACRQEFGVDSVEALSRRQASELIDRFSSRGGSARPAVRRAA